MYFSSDNAIRETVPRHREGDGERQLHRAPRA
jgi:hypothetical protein